MGYNSNKRSTCFICLCSLLRKWFVSVNGVPFKWEIFLNIENLRPWKINKPVSMNKTIWKYQSVENFLSIYRCLELLKVINEI